MCVQLVGRHPRADLGSKQAGFLQFFPVTYHTCLHRVGASLAEPCRKVVSKVRRHIPRSGVCTCIWTPIAKNIFGSGHACAIYAESTTGTLLAKGLRGCHSPITTGYLRPTKNPASPQHWRNRAMAKLEKQNSKARFIHIVLK